MYWYVKFPLYLVLLLALVGITVGVTRSCTAKPKPATSETSASAETGRMEEPQLPPIGEPVSTPLPEGAGQSGISSSAEPVLRNEALYRQWKGEMEQYPLKVRETALEFLKKTEEFSPDWLAAAQIVHEVNTLVLYESLSAPEKQNYTVQEGDSLDRIARKLETTVGALQRWNKFPPARSVIYPTQKLKYIAGPWSIRVSKKHFLLSLYRDGVLYRIYQISTGRQDRTPAGSFVIQNKSIHPDWTKGPGVVIPYGDPENILGPRWMGLAAAENTETEVTGLGIHGTTEPDKIGTASSLGCIRMRNEEVEELFDIIPEPRTPELFVKVEILE